MTTHRQSRHLRIALAALAGAMIGSTAAFGEDGSARKLPGVSGDYRIAKPAPKPEPDDALPAGGNGTFKIGDTDVRISGSITIDMATGSIRPPNH
ncbi:MULTISPECIES: hypothetical protein [unclassified Mesorhizobium]|uniref:hypothetical protein n=2 Tax=Mesorhizobium TaxID=68287 RepID=UPI000FCBF7A2|nr:MULTISPECIES: hypothetical protein [unclassified Mesorhizobium]TGP26580.1 hypothetical protein EN874_002620 [Mesorhizobium sp. M1D.F.Ca.ET.231.01.1.1]TGP38538.1 hypothetical protein EN877_02620 [Mesorhizobium sp. M1D.F.Ca.ET.234.01.1.1]TGS50748.1 hypothetical protein EN827_02620 [Mesorhizobium sp. M1D.F.Ca.ET.184.01.1.1]TGS66633.1 hypothetical protein EN826_002620 [Mesorhizobium sp. M1D.F.Ca.ET.183.01.1.1]